VQLLQDAQHVRIPVGRVRRQVRVAVDRPLPCGRHQRRSDLITLQVPGLHPPPGKLRQPPDLGGQLLPGRGGIERQGLGEQFQERPDNPVACGQRLAHRDVLRGVVGHQILDRGDRRL